ncbi:MAG TPA: glycoside hydrolase family 88 protein [Bryobacteraceae bacterium]|nr:glycoside hydrolase family 88 protein [Bryobacteraceae bacterium]
MSFYRYIGLPALMAGALAGGSVGLTQRGDILALMKKANAWQVAHPIVRVEDAPGGVGGDRNWERATWYTGVMAAWQATGDQGFYDQALAWGRHHQWQVGTEQNNGANRLFCVETWAQLYFATKDRAMIEPAIRWLDTKASNTPAGARRWYITGPDRDDPAALRSKEEGVRVYVDSLYGASALAMLAKATGDRKYLEIMHAFFEDVTAELFDRDAGLYYRDGRFRGRRTAQGRKILWSRGNGWAFAGIARILEYLPESDPKRGEYIGIYKRMAAELVRRQRADGLWSPNLDDPRDIDLPETSGTGFFTYGMAWGINHGVLSRDAYLPVVDRAWAGLAANVSPEGKVLWGQVVDNQPHRLEREDTHEYVTGTFLLAGSEVYKLAR